MLISSMGAPQGTVLSPVFFTLCTADFQYNSSTCHIQRFSGDTVTVACIKGVRRENTEAWCRILWSGLSGKTKEMVLDFRRASTTTALLPIDTRGELVEVVDLYKNLGVVLDGKLNWSANMNSVYKKGQSRMYFLRRLVSRAVYCLASGDTRRIPIHRPRYDTI